VRDPWGLNERLFAFYYPRLVARAENAGQRETRRQLVSHATGRTLELGAGSGLNLPHYTEAVTELTVTEPSEHMLAHLRAQLGAASPRVGVWKLVQCAAEQLPFPDASFDTVVATYVLCTTPDPARALAEVARILAPGGQYLFLEHVHAGEGTRLGRAQDLLELPHRYLAAGCYPNRRTEALLDRSPLQVQELAHGSQPRAIPTVKPTILGSARRPGETQASAAFARRPDS
jgi:SAM-dependent methyltransferase